MDRLDIIEQVSSKRQPMSSEKRGFAKKLRLEENQQKANIREENRQLGNESRIDRVTGLPNDIQFHEMLEGMGEAYNRDKSLGIANHGAFIIADLTGLHRTNDDISHDAGDEYLQSVAKSLSFRKEDRVFRMGKGSDEFVLHLRDTVKKDQLILILNRVDEELEKQEIMVRSKYPDIKYSLSYSIVSYGYDLSPKNAYINAINRLGEAKKSRNGERVGDVGRLFINEIHNV